MKRHVFTFACLISMIGLGTAHADDFGSDANEFSIDFVTIGNPNNIADTTGNPSTAGSVAYEYRMGKHEISRDMITKANNAASLGLTLQDMTNYGGNGVGKPATGVTWYEAAQFVNWLNTSNSHSAAYKFDGSGNFQLWAPADAGYDASNLFRNSNANYVLPSSDEWYKSAYFDPNKSGGAGYYNYATGSDIAPTAVGSGTTAGTAVYDQPSPNGPANIDLAGGLSPYGTLGQGGNVSEWEETEFDLLNNSVSLARGVRGGGWFPTLSSHLPSSYRFDLGLPSREGSGVGFRVASLSTATVPEPSALLVGVLAIGSQFFIRRRRK